MPFKPVDEVLNLTLKTNKKNCCCQTGEVELSKSKF